MMRVIRQFREPRTMEFYAIMCYRVNERTILMLAILLILSSSASAYITASLEEVCTKDEELSSELEIQPDTHFFRRRPLFLEEGGPNSAALLRAKMSNPPCSFVVEVPKDTHAISVSMKNFPKGSPCPLLLWFHEGNETWSLDICDREKRGFLALYPEVYPHRITLRWYPVIPKTIQRNDFRPRPATSEETIDIVVTAIARGSLCEDESRVLCWKMMKESLCVSEEFACDGQQNCPYPGNDESKAMCPQQNNGDFDQLKMKTSKAWDILTDHLNRILAVRTGDRELASSSENRAVQRSGFARKSGRRPAGGATVVGQEESNESGRGTATRIFGALPKLGPGSYVLLGMLACGSILLLCGLWECCCRTPNRETMISLSPRGSLATGGVGANTTTVVIISSTPPPPQYEELEQPPNYKELFPAKTKTTGS